MPPGPAAVRGRPVTLRLEGRAILAYEGETVGAALHAAGEKVMMRSIKYHRPRGLFCNTGKCASCLMRIDGTPNVRACVTPVHDGIDVRFQNAFPTARRDLFGVFDKVYRRNLDMHEKFTRPRPLAMVFQAITRRMAGFGKIPDVRPLRRPAMTRREVDVAIVGAGPAGLSAAAAAAEGAASVLLCDEADRFGGSLLLSPDRVAEADDLAHRVSDAGGTLLERSVAFGLYQTDGKGQQLPAPGLLAIMRPEGVVEVRPRAVVVASGYHEAPALVPNNDLPGVMGARAALILLHRHGILAGSRFGLAGEGALLAKARDDLVKAGAEAVEGDLTEIWGGTRVEGALVDGRKEPLDLVLCAGDETPRLELLQQGGARLAVRGWATVPDVDGPATSVRGLFAAGSVTDPSMPLYERMASGARAGEAAAAFARSVGR